MPFLENDAVQITEYELISGAVGIAETAPLWTKLQSLLNKLKPTQIPVV